MPFLRFSLFNWFYPVSSGRNPTLGDMSLPESPLLGVQPGWMQAHTHRQIARCQLKPANNPNQRERTENYHTYDTFIEHFRYNITLNQKKQKKSKISIIQHTQRLF